MTCQNGNFAIAQNSKQNVAKSARASVSMTQNLIGYAVSNMLLIVGMILHTNFFVLRSKYAFDFLLSIRLHNPVWNVHLLMVGSLCTNVNPPMATGAYL